MNTKAKTSNLKIAKMLLLIGGIILAVGIIMIVMGINQQSKISDEYNIKKTQYETEYEQWKEAWFDGNAELSDQPERPEMPGISLLIIVGVGVSVVSLVPLFLGARPFFIKVGAKMTKETLDYVGDDISAVGEKSG